MPEAGYADVGIRLETHLLRFARALRNAGLSVGPDKVHRGVESVVAVGIGNRRDFYSALKTAFVDRADQGELFDQTFEAFWSSLGLHLRLPRTPVVGPPRVVENVLEGVSARALSAPPVDRRRAALGRGTESELGHEADAAMSASGRERLRHRDFEQMSPAEVKAAKAAIENLRLTVSKRPTRRFEQHPRGTRVDLRASLRSALRSGPGSLPLLRKRRRRRAPPLVVICDISGSMSRYARMLLHFIHGVCAEHARVSCFVFGTRLTNVSRCMRQRDIENALCQVSRAVADWSGGTRIGGCLREFNRKWSRRVLGQGAVVLFITDGLDRDAGDGLEAEMERLHRSCRRLIWLNPLLRYPRFEPKSLGMQAILPHVDDLRTVHNLSSLEELAVALGEPKPTSSANSRRWF